MKEKKNYYFVLFSVTADAMHLEKICRENSVPGRLVPVPQVLSAGCGLCWRSAAEDCEKVKNAAKIYSCKFQRECFAVV